MKHKLKNRNVNKEDWEEIGKNKVMTTTVLDDIFKKYLDYKEIDKRQPQTTKNLSTLEPIDGGSMAKHTYFSNQKRLSVAQTTME